MGQSVSVSLEFDKDLQEATATLGGNRISSLSATVDKKVWVGDVQVPSTALLSVDLVVSQFKDLTGNIGAWITESPKQGHKPFKLKRMFTTIGLYIKP